MPRHQGRGPRVRLHGAEAITAFDAGELSLQSKVDIRFPVGTIPPRGWTPPAREEGEPEYQQGDTFRLNTTLGRALFNELLPEDYPFVDYEVGKSSSPRSSTTSPSATRRSSWRRRSTT
ncbi:hypothetical protein SGRIM128S_00573 [Streptomyces griseomycini]